MKGRYLFLILLTILPLGLIRSQENTYIIVGEESKPQTSEASTSRQNVTTTKKVYEKSEYTGKLLRDSLKRSEDKTYKTTFMKNGFWDNWFVAVAGGPSVLMSEESRYVDAAELMKPTAMIVLGKWVSPSYGIRFSVAGGELKGFATWHEYLDANGNPTQASWGYGDWYIGTNYNSPIGRPRTNTYLDASIGQQRPQDPGAIKVGDFIKERFLENPMESSKGSGYDYTFSYVTTAFDFCVNLTNLFGYYNPKRLFNLNAYGGIGFSHTFKDGNRTAVNNLMERFSMEANFRLSNQWSFGIEPQLLIMPEIFDRRAGDGNTMDGVANLMCSFTYKFGEANFYQPKVTREEVTVINNIVNETRENCCDELKERLRRIEEMLENRQPVQQKIDKEHLKIVVHFVIDKHEVRPSEMYKLDEVARFMAKYPQVKVSVTGYADVKTAYPSYNMKLSERRVNEVVRILGAKYGIDKNRLETGHFGDTVQPFDVNELNRAVIAFDIPEE